MNTAKLAVLLVLGSAVCAAEVKVGDSSSDVRAALGKPRGDVRAGAKEVLYFDRGTVEMRNGAVSRVDLMSDSDFSVFAAKKKADEALASAERDRLFAEGEALKSRKLTDPTFAATPYTYQIAYWQNFAARYPGVSVADEIALARSRFADQVGRQAATEERLAELEARIDDSETRNDAPVYRYASYGYGDSGYYSDYGAGSSRYSHHHDDNGGRGHQPDRHASSNSHPDYNPYRWNPTKSSTGGVSFPTYPFGPLSPSSTTTATTSHHGHY